MKQITVLAVDDEGPALRRLVKMTQAHPRLQLVGTAKNAYDAKQAILELQPQLVLLDIQLKDATAFEMLSEVVSSFHGKIIFITAYDKYAIKAFEYEAIDYLLKPFTEDRFDAAISRIALKDEASDLKNILEILKSPTQSSPKMMVIPEGIKSHFIEKESIQYIYAEGYYVHFVLENERKLIRISLKKLVELLPENFIRINKSTIINRDHIVELITNRATAKVIMSRKNEFYISAVYAEEFERRISN